MNPNTQTDVEHIAELREAADEAQTARLEVVSEIARLTKALRKSETEWREFFDALGASESELAAARKALGEMTFARDVALTLANNMIDERNAAQQDAERLAKALHTIAWEPIGESEASYAIVYEDILIIAKDALAAHAAATGKQVTR